MPILILFLVLLVIAIVVLPFVAVSKASAADRRAGVLARRMRAVEDQLRSLAPRTVSAASTEPARQPVQATEVAPGKAAEPAAAAGIRFDEPKPAPAATLASQVSERAAQPLPAIPPPLPPK